MGKLRKINQNTGVKTFGTGGDKLTASSTGSIKTAGSTGRLVKIRETQETPKTFGTKSTLYQPSNELVQLAYDSLRSGTIPATTQYGMVNLPTGAQKSAERRRQEYASDIAAQKRSELITERASINQPGRVYNQKTTEKNRQRVQELDAQISAQTANRDAANYSLKYMDTKRPDNFIGQFAANYDVGRMGQDIGKAWNDYLEDPTPEKRAYAESLSSTMEDYVMRNQDALSDDGTLPIISKSFANYLPQFIDQQAAGIQGALAGGALGSVAGSFAPGIGTAVGASKGAKSGYAAARSLQMYQLARGAAFKALLDAGVDEETAREAADDEATISSIIEGGDAALDLLLLGGGNLIQAILGQGASQAGTSALKSALLTGAKYAGSILSEGAQEWTQEGVSIANIARSLEGNQPGTFGLTGATADQIFRALSGQDPEALAQMNEAGKAGMEVAAIMGGGQLLANQLLTNRINSGRMGAQTYQETEPLLSLAMDMQEEQTEQPSILAVEPKVEERPAQSTQTVQPSAPSGVSGLPSVIETQQRENAQSQQQTAPAGRNPSELSDIASSLGENGSKALFSFYYGDQDTDVYSASFLQAYNAGYDGKDFPGNLSIMDSQAMGAYYAGQNDAKLDRAALPTNTVSQSGKEIQAGGEKQSAAVSVPKAETEQPFTATLYHGSGADPKDIYMGVQYPVAGQGRYYAMSEEQARAYGDQVEKEEVTLNNPIVIKDDEDWREVAGAAGWPYANMFGASEEEVIKAADDMRNYVLSSGHDGLVIQYDDDRRGDVNINTGNRIKTLDNVFGHDQVVVYTKDQLAAAATETKAQNPLLPKSSGSSKIKKKAVSSPNGAMSGKATRLMKKWAQNEWVNIDLDTALSEGADADTRERAEAFVRFFDKWYQAGAKGERTINVVQNDDDLEFPPFLQETFYQAGKEEAAAKRKKEGTANGETVVGKVPDQGAVLREPEGAGRGSDVSGPRAGGLLDQVPAQNVPEDEGRGDLVPNAGRGGDQTQRPAMRPDAAGNERGHGLGSGEGADLQPAAGEVSRQEEAATEVTATPEPRENADETTKEIAQKEAEAVTEQPRGRNFVIGASLDLPRGEKARFKANVEAIQLLRTLMKEERYATEEEQLVLSKYVGWGGLSGAFDERNEKWAKEYKQLKALLSEDEYKSARGSTLNAHYTDLGVIRAMYDGLRHFGFQGGRMLEPSAGIGHFIGGMPIDLSAQVKSWTAVELDSITGSIAKYLYPNADVRVQGFERANIPDNYMDVVISNVPFGNYAITDKAYPKSVTGAIHNYFFAKALDKVRPGGLVMFITSRYTMDSTNTDVRRYIAQRADLLGAVRLPDSAFQSNAGTEVVTDILVLKKREPNTLYQGAEFDRSVYRSLDGIYESINTYFDEHPEMVLGTPAASGSMYRKNSLTYKAKPGNLEKQITAALNSISGQMDYTHAYTQEEIRAEIRASEKKGKNGSMVVKNGSIFKNNNGVLETVELQGQDAKRTMAILEIRDDARNLLSLQMDGAPDAQIKDLRRSLNEKYDAFVAKNGPLNSQKNQRLFKEDTDKPFILSLENYDKKTKKAEKAAIFFKNTVSPVKTITHVDTVEEGLIVSVNETGGVDVDRIAALTGESADAVSRRLLDARLVFKNRDGSLETAERYLSGNVRAKLKDAEALAEMDRDYKANVEELRKVIPADIPAEEIKVRPGVTWVPDSVYSDFAAELLGTRNTEWSKAVSVTYNRAVGQYNITINNRWLKSSVENTQTWGTSDRSFVNILTAVMNNKSLTVRRKLEDGSHVVDAVATAAVKEKEEKILQEFQDWIWRDDGRKKELSSLYNEMFNNLVTPTYNGDHLTVNGSNPDKPLRPHQRNAVQRVISSGGNTLLAHKVGAGKTYEMAASAMKLRQLGIVKKPMFVVPKSLVAQWGNEFLDFFPAAKILVLSESDFSAKNRKVFANRIATGDYDAVILSQEQFKAVPMSDENQEQFYQDQITALEIAMEDAAANLGRRDPSIKQMEKAKKSFEAKLRRLADSKKDEDNINFESLGVDSIFVDEAHSYKNLFYTTNMSNVSGLGNKDGSQKAFDLYMKVRYLQKLNGGRGIVFATATPVMNSMSEMYIMQKYLQEDMLDQRGLVSFDAWANQFGEVVTVLEMNPSGKGYRQKQSFSRFKNLAELQQMFRSFADVITEIPGLKIPSMKDGKRIVVESEPSQFQMDYIDKLAQRADAIKGRKVDPKDDNMLKITSEGRKLSYTQRMLDPSLPYEAGNKVEKCVDNVLSIWKESKKTKGTQLIFCDLSTPKGGQAIDAGSDTVQEDTDVEQDEISIYDDMKSMLISRGIPSGEIAFIHDANTNEKKARLFEAVNNGEVRVLIGSTGKMGVGMNAQKRIVALHHLDAPWRPGDIEQREGRALRQGNMNDEVGIYVYVTKKTFDSRMWDNLQRKSTFIHQIMAGDVTAREAEGDGDFALSAAEIKAISSGDPAILEQFEVSTEIAKLEALERAHAKEVRNAKASLDQAKKTIAQSTEYIEKIKRDLSQRQDTSGENFSLLLDGTVYKERKDAGAALVSALKSHLETDRTAETMYDVGRFAGFTLSVTNGGDVLLRGSNIYRVRANMDSPTGTIQSLEAALKRMDRSFAEAQERLSASQASISKLEKIIGSKFERAQELSELRRRNSELLAQLNPVEDTNIAETDEESDNFLEADGVDRMAEMVDHSDQWTAERVGSAEKTPMPLSDIVEKIRHDFGINITTGHIRGSKTRGQYNRNDQGIRSKIANDLPTVAHELGHHLDNVYSLTKNLPAELREELTENLDQGMKDQYPKKKWVTEGLAEYVRRFLQNRETAAIDYPKFTEYFLSSMHNTDGPLLEHLADEVNAYYSLDAETATSSIRLGEDGGADFRTLKEKLQDVGDAFYQAWVDSNTGIRRFAEEAGNLKVYRTATNASYADAMAGQILVGDLTDRYGRYVGPGLKTALSGINLKDKNEYRAFGEYLVVRHGPERLREGLRVFADDRKNSSQWMEARRAELEEQYPAFPAAAERLYQFESQFLSTWGVETGLVSQSSQDKWEERWASYVPFNRAMDKRRPGARRGYANQSSGIKKAIGSGLDIVHPVDNIIFNVVRMVTAGIRNNVMVEITQTAERAGGMADFLEKVPMPIKRTAFNASGVKETLKQGVVDSTMSEADKDAAFDIINNIDDILYQYGRGRAGGNVVAVMKNGKPEYWKINDKLLLESVSGMTPAKAPGWLEAYGAVSRFMTGNITGNNVLWSIFSNAPRDLMTFFTYSKEKNPLKLLANIGAGYANRLKGQNADPLYKEYLAMGGGRSSAYTADRDLAKRTRQHITGNKLDYINPMEWLSFISDTVEMGPRYAYYKIMRERGFGPERAFYESSDITVNFRRGGTWSRSLNKVIPFFNASVQGIDKFSRWLRAMDADPDVRGKVARSRIFAYIAVSAALAAVMYGLNNKDEEDEKNYEQLSTYTKNSYWCIPLGDGKYFTIPKPRELAVLTSYFETAMEYFIGGNKHAFDEFYNYAVENALPNVVSDVAKGDIWGGIGSLGVLGVGANMMANRDFMGRPIVSSGLQSLEKKDQYNNRTSMIAKLMGETFHQSPQMIDYFFQQTLGGFWKAQKALFPVGKSEIDPTLGIQGTYIRDNQYSTDLINWLYDTADASERAKNSDPENLDKQITYKLDSNMSTFYSRYYAVSKDAPETVASRATRQTVLTMTLDYQSARDEGYKTSQEKQIETLCKSLGSTELMPTVMQNTIKDAKDETHTLSGEQYVEYQTDYLRLYWEGMESGLSRSMSQSEQIAIAREVKQEAADQAKERALKRMGLPYDKDVLDTGSLDIGEISAFEVAYDMATGEKDENGKTISGSKQQDVIEALEGMYWLTDEERSYLFGTKYSSDKNNPWK